MHRLTISIAGALAAAAAIGLMSSVDFADHSVSPRLLAAQSAVIALLAAGFAHALQLPAELRANWVFVITWDDHARRYVNGVRRLLLLIAMFALIVGYPFHVLALGGRAATYHFLIGLLWANVCMRIVSGSIRAVPFIRSYSADDSLKLWLPIFVLVGSGLVWMLGTAEALAMGSSHESWLPAGLVLLVVGLGLAERGRQTTLETSDAEMGGTVRLGLGQ